MPRIITNWITNQASVNLRQSKLDQDFFFLPQCYDLHVSYGESKTKTNKQKTKITNKKLKSTNILRLMYTPLRGQKINEEIGEKKNKIYIYMFIYSYKQKTKCDCIRPMKQRKSVRVKIITNGCLK